MTTGVVLIGPPAAGKDTITAELELISRFRLLRKMKAGTGRTAGYTPVTERTFEDLRAEGAFVSTVSRYGNSYAVPKDELTRLSSEGFLPVIHTASIDEARLLARLGMSVGLIWCDRATATLRLRGRDPDTVGERLEAWDRVQRSIGDIADELDFVVDTTTRPAAKSAEDIRAVVDYPVEPEILRRQLLAVRPDLAMVVPVVTFRDDRGDVALDRFEQHLEHVMALGVAVLVTGSTGRGRTLSPSDRIAVRRVAEQAVSADRLTTCFWGVDDLATHRSEQPAMLVPDEVSVLDRHRSSHGPSTMIYSHPRMGGPFGIDQLNGWFGIKLSKVAVGAVSDHRRALGSQVRIWHGSASDVTGSVRAGADGIVAAELNAWDGGALPVEAGALQQVIDGIRGRWPENDHEARVAWLERSADLAEKA